ncbi:hypothetical protein DWQ65_06670 [Treponema phagedenis]|uniref:Uncharacterized protein n=1 Tax=Treponema phagedenis TaxID=162 RepID=A0A0B7GUH2_TREPH|nr:hypothetical protein [Treponema phagedenis]EFW37119.1 hypothetical protein HMPREF9554_02428 [Treponema phagedenis F0421]NVP24442.1 hypothetical protein [Treponema phagedenis]QEJ95460.1 hypothetical protein FUT79_09770 [Treponema phagedenis]QEJ97798.1 hypothetical protein FUT82_07180 [Treponema phagedenis]QEK01314.1 hypothetical protein FUT84_09245 [Treponema phagedenis]
MPEIIDWEDKKYKEIFEDELRLLSRRRKNDPSCTLSDIEGILHSLYIIDGNNQEGRSTVQQISLSATIAAYEHFIYEWKGELKK